MNVKTKIELDAAVTPADILRHAISTRESFSKQVEAIRAKASIFAPIEAEVAVAEAELQTVLQQDARAMQEWASAGAEGAPPEPQHRAREAATTKVSAARAKLNATGIAKASFEDEISNANRNYGQAQVAVTNAERAVIGQELLLRAHAMKKAATDYLNSETRFFIARNAAASIGGCDGYFSQAQEITRPLVIEDESALSAATRSSYEIQLAGLLRGENPES